MLFVSSLEWYPGSDPSDLLGLSRETPLSFTLIALMGRSFQLEPEVHLRHAKQGVCSDSGNPPGETTPTQQPHQSWRVSDGLRFFSSAIKLNLLLILVEVLTSFQ